MSGMWGDTDRAFNFPIEDCNLTVTEPNADPKSDIPETFVRV